MKQKRTLKALGALAMIGMVSAVVVAWPQILERYYVWQLASAEGDDGWIIAARLADLESDHATEWYGVKLSDDAWEVRERAAAQLANIASERAIKKLLELTYSESAAGMRAVGLPGGTSLHLGNSWNAEDTELAAQVINERLRYSGARAVVRRAGRISFTLFQYGTTSHASEAARALRTIAKSIRDATPRARAMVEALANDKTPSATQRNAHVVVKLLPDPDKMAITFTVTKSLYSN